MTMGLSISVYRNVERGLDGDCTNGGISSRFGKLVVVNCDGPSEPSADAPPVLLVSHVVGCLALVPAHKNAAGDWVKVPSWTMMGGNYGATSDSRFGEKARELLAEHYKVRGRPVGRVDFYGAVAIHDRIE
jgi:hypothetical protein